MPYEMASMYLAGRIENGGPAPARDLLWSVTQMRDGEPTENAHRYAQPLLGAGRYRSMMLHHRKGSQTLREMGDLGITFEATWEWKDGRRSRLGLGPHLVHKRSATWVTRQLVEDFYQAWVLTETPPMLKVGDMADGVRKAIKELPKIRAELERAHRREERALADDQ